jgi:hypothetical protein
MGEEKTHIMHAKEKSNVLERFEFHSDAGNEPREVNKKMKQCISRARLPNPNMK